MTLDEKILVKMLKEDNSYAFKCIFDKYQQRVFLFSCNYIGKPEAEEIVQSVFVKVWESRKTINEEMKFSSYLFTISKNSILNYLRYNTYYRVALEGWKGIQTKIDEQGAILDVCKQTPTSDDLVFYYNKPAPFNEFHGTGAIMFAGIEMAKLKEQRRILQNRNKTN